MPVSEHKGHLIAYSDFDEGYDAQYCVDCNEWIEKRCSDPLCVYCVNRPEKPLPSTVNDKAIESRRRAKAAWAAVQAGTYDPNKEY